MKVLRFILFPFAILYDLVTRMRNLFFDVGLFKQTVFKTPIIVVGNLSVGGTGKTPQVEYLVRLLKAKYKIAILSRGYKRETKGFVLLNSTHAAADVGDEPLQYFKKFKNVSVAVAANRVAGINSLNILKKPNVFILDDAFQHRKVQPSFSILLTKFNDLFVNDFLLPTGNLRESKSGASRANVIVVTKCPDNLAVKEQEKIKKKLLKFNKRIFFTSISYSNEVMGSVVINTNELMNYEVLLVTGIANSTPLIQFLESIQVQFQHLKYEDHHAFSEEDVLHIQSTYANIKGSKLLLTTEKDYVRLSNKIKVLSYLPIETLFLNNQAEEFNMLINNHLLEKF